MIKITNIKTILLVPKPHAFIDITLVNSFSFFFTKLFTYIKTTKFNIIKIVALLLSGFIILCIRYIFNFYNYAINISLLFIIFCAFLKQIILVIIEYMNETNVFWSIYKKKKLKKYFFSYNNFNNNNIINYKDTYISSYNTNLYDIHIPITLEKLKDASNLYEVDTFFKLIYEQEIKRHQNKLKELVYEAVLTGKVQKELLNKIEEEYIIFKERLYIIEEDRCTHVVFLRVKKNIKY
jgi:hypothetical protein